MCIQTLVDDGGLEAVLRTSDRVWNELCSLHEKKLALVATGTDARSTSSTAATRSKMRARASLFGGDGGSKVLDLSQHSESELKRAVAPLIIEMEKLDAAALLSLNPIEQTAGNKSSKSAGATLDLKRGLTVTPIHDRVFPPCDNYCSDDDDDDDQDEIMDGMKVNNSQDESNGRNRKNVVRYLHVVDIPHKYSVGIFVFPPYARMPLHDHPNMVVLSRVLYGELQVESYDIVHPVGSTSNYFDDNADVLVSAKNNTDTDTAIIDDEVDDELTTEATSTTPSNSPTRTTGVLRRSFTKIKDFISMKMVSHSSHDNNDEGDSTMQRDSALYVRPNFNPVGAMQRRSSLAIPMLSSVEVSNVCDDTGTESDDLVIISAPSVTCLFPREGNCHAFVAGPHGAALLDVLLPPYDSEEVRDCTFYEVANEHNPIQSTATTSSSLKLSPIDQPEDFHCVSGSYGRFGACKHD